MTGQYLPDARIEDKALRLLNRYELGFGVAAGNKALLN